MCDTLVAVGNATADGTVILAKNSDREANEAQALTYVRRAKHRPGATVRCTYVEIPQVPETYEILLSRPFWMWGGEMGANEWGVAIGNEAVFTREPYGKQPGLIGMDLLRLALERTDTARKALELIINLLETYGQSGNCGFRHRAFYHNSFIIADPHEAWALETAGGYWAAERVQDVRTISNGLTIGGQWDMASPGLVDHAIEKGWCSSREDFGFARCYSDPIYTRLDGCRSRQCRSTELLQAKAGQVTVETMMAALRDHGPKAAADPLWNPGRGWLMETLCVHASLGPTRPSQSAGSLVAHLADELATFWMTGTSSPCTGLFKPVYLGGAGLPELGPEPTGSYDARSLWWSHERLHRATIRDFASRMPVYRQERDALEQTFLHRAAELSEQYRLSPAVERARPLAQLSASCFEQAAQAAGQWASRVSATPIRNRPPLPFSLAWATLNRQAGFPEGQ